MITKEQIIDIARDELTPIGWHEEHAKYIDGLDAFAERLVKLCNISLSVSGSLVSPNSIQKEAGKYQKATASKMAIERTAFAQGALWVRSLFLPNDL